MPVDTGQNETNSIVFDCSVLVMKPFRSNAKRLVKKFVKLLHWHKFEIEGSENNLKSKMSYNGQVQESSRQTIKNQKALYKNVIIKELENASEIIVSQKRIIEVQKRQTEICATEEKMRLWTSEIKEGCILWIQAFQNVKSTVPQSVLQNTADQVFWKEESSESLGSSVALYRYFLTN